MQINRRRVLVNFVLLVRRRDHVRMTMPHADRHDAAETVEVTLARVVPDVLHLALDEHERLFVVEENAGVQELFALRQHFGGGRAGVFLRFVIRGR